MARHGLRLCAGRAAIVAALALASVMLALASLPSLAQLQRPFERLERDPPRGFARMQNYANVIDGYIAQREFDRSAWRDEREIGEADIEAFAAAARIYSQRIAPQFRAYLDSLGRLNDGFRVDLKAARDTLDVVSGRPDTPQARKAMRATLQALEKILSLPAQRDDLARLADVYGQQLALHRQLQQQMARLREQQMDRKRDIEERNVPLDRRRERIERDRRSDDELDRRHDRYIPGTNYPEDSADIMRRAYPGAPQAPDIEPPRYPTVPRIPDPLPGRHVIEREQYGFNGMAFAADSALAALPALKTCIADTKEREGGVRRALDQAMVAEGRYDVMRMALDALAKAWPDLIRAVAACSSSDMWGG